ncbi:uncharacterized protein LOC143037711 [Oratosquilla oratoria]|uniref:uncharacterized protein LOC143037711 n=1 Tax=Oratosquilla oratoria TaxID=337810 RepID=UPI003F763266
MDTKLEISHRWKDKSSRGADADQTSNFANNPIDLNDYEKVLKNNEEALKRYSFTSGWRRELIHSRKDNSSRGPDVDQTSNFATKPIDLTHYEEVLKNNEEALKRCNFTSGWRRVRVLGEGGFGKVFLLKNEKMKRLIARKVVLSQPSKRGFTFEEVIQIQLSHPNVLTLFCWEQKMRTLSLNLEYCSKGNLTTNMPYLSENELNFYFKQLLDGVKYIHSRDQNYESSGSWSSKALSCEGVRARVPRKA